MGPALVQTLSIVASHSCTAEEEAEGKEVIGFDFGQNCSDRTCDCDATDDATKAKHHCSSGANPL